MATNTKNFKFKKPDESDFYDVQDQNGNWDMADEELEKLNAPTFEDYSGGALLPEASSAIDGIKSGFGLPTLLSNIKAAFKGACLLGHIVNNCVTNRSDLPLSAAQGKALMDMLTKLNGDLSIEAYEVLNWGCEIIKANYVRKYGKVVHVYFNFTVKADHVAPYTSLFSLPCKPISMAEVLPPFFRRIDGTQIPTRYLSDYGVIQSTYTLDVSSDYVFEWVFICE